MLQQRPRTIPLSDRGLGGWLNNVFHFVVQLLHRYWATKETIAEWLHIDLGLIPHDLTGQIVRREQYPTSIGTFSDVWKCTVAVKTIRGHREDALRQDKIEVCHHLALGCSPLTIVAHEILHDHVERWKTFVHKNVLPVYGTTLNFGPLPSLVSPWVDGGSLTHYLDLHSNFSREQRHEILIQISDGLCYRQVIRFTLNTRVADLHPLVHSKEVMHGQLNGSNVLMDSRGNAYLADFGFLPVVLEFRAAPYVSTAIGNSVRWAAPELFELPETNDGPPLQLSMPSDIYSFGSIMLQVLSGDIPYHTITRDDQVLYAIARNIKPDRPETSMVTDEHWEFIQRCWSSRRENKRPSATDVSAFLAIQHPPPVAK
ncbi:kinase-like protein [Paxillus ammoniavirescens]|nr:kinase-like protein [Paxillus ammoniavirescens]